MLIKNDCVVFYVFCDLVFMYFGIVWVSNDVFFNVFIVSARRSGRQKNKSPLICENIVEEAIDADAEDSDDDFQKTNVPVSKGKNKIMKSLQAC